MPSLPKISNIKAPKLPTPPTKINVATGKGTPGGFTGKAKSGLKSLSNLKGSSLPKLPPMPNIQKLLSIPTV